LLQITERSRLVNGARVFMTRHFMNWNFYVGSLTNIRVNMLAGSLRVDSHIWRAQNL